MMMDTVGYVKGHFFLQEDHQVPRLPERMREFLHTGCFLVLSFWSHFEGFMFLIYSCAQAWLQLITADLLQAASDTGQHHNANLKWTIPCPWYGNQKKKSSLLCKKKQKNSQLLQVEVHINWGHRCDFCHVSHESKFQYFCIYSL